MIYDVGDRATVTTELRNAQGELTAATVTLTVTGPDGTITTPSVSDNGGTGLYASSFLVPLAGTWRYKWTASGALVGVDSGQLSVVDAGRILVAGLDEFRAQLDRADTSDDAELRLYLEAATNQIEWLIGPLSPTTVTERHSSFDRAALRRFPVVSVTSVATVTNGVADSPVLASNKYMLDAAYGELRFTDWYGYGYGGRSDFEITYVVGRTSIPADIKLAGLIIAQHLWSVQNARWTINAPGDDQLQVIPGSGFMVPYRALELLRPYISVATVGGIA